MGILSKIKEVFKRIKNNKKITDSGMRTDSSGNIYVDNKVFFGRDDVKREIQKLIDNQEMVK
ncbi:hypothetical protein [Empedobacter brevis]|uniref:hypothetical protein n=1 Tax=Empedobacter brevis TaxID=247 RepID=UPI00333F7C7F